MLTWGNHGAEKTPGDNEKPGVWRVRAGAGAGRHSLSRERPAGPGRGSERSSPEVRLLNRSIQKQVVFVDWVSL